MTLSATELADVVNNAARIYRRYIARGDDSEAIAHGLAWSSVLGLYPRAATDRATLNRLATDLTAPIIAAAKSDMED